MATDWRARAAQVARSVGIPAQLFVTQIGIESMDFDPDVISGRIRSPKGATGIAQFMPATAADFNLNPLDPEASLWAGARYMQQLHGMFGDWRKALAAYNWGPGNMQQAVGRFGANWRRALPQETERYVNDLFGLDAPLVPGTSGSLPQQAYPSREYANELARLDRLRDMRDTALDDFAWLQRISRQTTELSKDDKAKLDVMAARHGAAEGITLQGAQGAAATAGVLASTLQGAVNSQIDQLEQDIGRSVERLVSLSPVAAVSDPSVAVDIPFDKQLDIIKAFTPSAGSAPQLFAPHVLTGPGGKVVMVDPNTNQTIDLGTFPELADRPNLQITTNPRTGALVAVDPQNPTAPPVVLIPDFDFPAIDPEVLRAENIRQFEENLALTKQQVAGQFIGLELERRGQQLQAYTEDMAFQIEAGTLEAQIGFHNLDIISEAFNQRRKEREVLLQVGVTRASLRTRGTETVTALPGGEQLTSLLGQITGQQFPSTFAELPVGNIDPEGAFQQVMQGSQFQSPIPGLMQNLQTTRGLIGSLLGAPLGNDLVNSQTAQQLASGVSDA